ncbi:MAG: DUF3047 domain-containing protein [Candidatus Omnitrophota bacterium]
MQINKITRLFSRCGYILGLIFISSSLLYASAAFLKSFPFDYPDALKQWQRMVLNREVDYTLMNLEDDGFVRAFSDKACSALYYKMRFDINEHQILKWKWKVTRFPDLSGAKTDKDMDDYAARVYVIFPYFTFSYSQFLEYVWSDSLPVGTIISSPYGDNVKIIVLRSGGNADGEWAMETRNLCDDYAAAFGNKPTRKAGAIAIMCDADSSKTAAESYFDAIEVVGSEEL